jgi:hypothetical protein
MQDFQVIVENAKKMAQLKKHIKVSAPQFKGNTKWLTQDISGLFVERHFDTSTNWQYRFMTVTFDSRKFSFNELTNPKELITYGLNAIYSLRNLFKENPLIIIEYHKTGIPHFHINYTVNGVLELATLKLRMQYYFSKDLRNKYAVHDRVFNEGGHQYMQKSNTSYYQFKIFEKPLDLFLV